MGMEGPKKKKIEKMIRGVALAGMVLGKLASGDAAAAGMAGNREAIKKLDGIQTSEMYHEKNLASQEPPKKKEDATEASADNQNATS